MNILSTAILFCVAGVSCVAGQVRRIPVEEFADLKVYRIESRLNDGVLTANQSDIPDPKHSNRTILVTSANWSDDASQKWRLDKSVLYSSYMLHPTQNENFNLEYDKEGGFFHWFWTWGFGYNKFWYLVDAGEGYSMIKNHPNKVCITAVPKLGVPLIVGECDNSVAQQWKFVLLSKNN